MSSFKDFFMKPTELPYDYDEWKKKPYYQRAKEVCQAWGMQGFGAPKFTVIFYTLKIAAYVWLWFVFCSFSTELGPASEVSSWWFSTEAVGKAIIWTTLLEVFGLGGASGPLTARYMPSFGASLYYLRPKTLKVPMFPKVPILGNDTRNIIDVLLYAALLYFLFTACIASKLTPDVVLPILILLPILGILDKQIFLAARADVYYPAMLCFMFPMETLPALKFCFFGVWFWAAFSKLTPAFTSVVGVMICNSPFLKFKWLKKLLYKSYPDDLRASDGSRYVAHFGTLVEFVLPLIIFFSNDPEIVFYAVVGITAFHTFIFLNFPMGVPMEWNIIMVYGAWALFAMRPEVVPWTFSHPVLIAAFALSFLILPLFGSMYPKYVSFLLSMRYYAGTWAYSVWLFKDGAKEKIDNALVKTSPDLRKQLSFFYDKKTYMSILSRTIAFRLIHYPSRTLHDILPKAVGDNMNDYYWVDGEFFAGEIIGWNFGDGHLHDQNLLASLRKRVDFEPGEVRVVMVESPQLHNGRMHWRIHDGRDGLMEEGYTYMKDLKERLPWPREAEWKAAVAAATK